MEQEKQRVKGRRGRESEEKKRKRLHHSNAEECGLRPPKHKELESYFPETSFILPCVQKILIGHLALCRLVTRESPDPAMKAGQG